MKKGLLIRISAILLSALMLLAAVACGNASDETVNTTAADTTSAITEEETSYVPDIEVKNYDEKFNIITGHSVPAEKIALEELDKAEAGDVEIAVYERGLRIKEHLGVTLVMQDGGDWMRYADTVMRSVSSNSDDYQLVLTNVYYGVAPFVANGYLYDIGELDAVNLDAPYWAGDLMEDIRVEDKYYLGYGDMCLSDVLVVIANKDLMEKYNITAPYDDVRNRKWTLDKMAEIASLVSENNGDPKWDETDVYGISGLAWIPFISFITSSDMKIVDRDENGVFSLAYSRNSEKMLSLIEKLTAMHDAEYSYFWPHTTGVELDFASGNTLFQLYHSSSLETLRSEAVRFGILPYPLYDENQKEYKSLNWNGLIAVPTTIGNPDMVGEVLELMNYYSADVKVAYHEKLLGTKLADSPDDAEMLNIIWASQTSDVGLICCNCNDFMDKLVYMVPSLVGGYKNAISFSSYLGRYTTAAQRGLDKVFKQ
ncbi:MAG: extracellular solute-binding protein [Clostridia bacterium]|nr:extracellular solute-binding protein [Clostridia bacterium]